METRLGNDAGAAGTPDLREHYRLTRFLFFRFLGLIYFVAFLSLSQQYAPLIGSEGLLPANRFLARVGAAYAGKLSAFFALPTIFWWNCSDACLGALAYSGLALATLLLVGFADAPLLAALWFLYMSFVHVGQLFYGYGWEILVLETGFLAIFFCPLLEARPLASQPEPPLLVVWLLRWVLFRVMFGAGMIKLRGDPCWRQLTCLLYHYETQPIPNPFSWYLNQLPVAVERVEVLFNHFVELIVPWSVFAPRRLRHAGGVFLVAFQLILIVSGNLSWLNWLTITLCIACFDDQAVARLFPRPLRRRLLAAPERAPSLGRRLATYALAALIVVLSVGPVSNLLGAQQIMNGSFGPFNLVNTYGAFGSVTRERREIVLEGTTDAAIGPATQWREYEFKCAPGDVDRRPCFVSPYHYRLDWQIWFAAMEEPQDNPWLLHFIAKLLQGDRGALGLLATNPFPEAPPRSIRAELYAYHFTRCSDHTRAWWRRRRLGDYLPPLSRNDPRLRRFLERYGGS